MNSQDEGKVMTTRCKFRCDQVIQMADSQSVVLNPVVDGSPENKDFFKYTPSGKIELQIINKNVKFEAGKQYFIDISEAK